MSKLKTYEVKIKKDCDQYFMLISDVMNTWPAKRCPMREFIFDDRYEAYFIMECTEKQMADLKKRLNIK